MGMCCEKMMMIGWRNAWSMKLRVQGQEERGCPRGLSSSYTEQSWCHGSLQMDEDDNGCPMIRMGVSGWMFLLIPAFPGSPRQKAVKRLCVCVLTKLPSFLFSLLKKWLNLASVFCVHFLLHYVLAWLYVCVSCFWFCFALISQEIAKKVFEMTILCRVWHKTLTLSASQLFFTYIHMRWGLMRRTCT